MDAVGNIAAMRVAQSMQTMQARFAEIESRTGISFSAHLQNSRPYTEAADPYESASGAYPAGAVNLFPSEREGLAFSLLPQSDYDSLFLEAGERYGLDAAFIKAVAFAESGFRPGVVSSAGAMGLMQLMPSTAEALGVDDPFDPWQNIDGGARYLAQQLDRFDGDALLAIAAYNCGAGRIVSREITSLSDPAQRALLPSETQGYLERIEAYLEESRIRDVLDNPYINVNPR